MGADLVKIFPADLVGGPYFIKQMQGPFPDVGSWSRGELGECSRIRSNRSHGYLSWQRLLRGLLAEKGNTGFVKEIKEFIKRVEESQA